MFNINTLLKKLSSNWDPEADFNTLNSIKENGDSYVLVIKKSIWYGIFSSIFILLIMAILIANLTLIGYSATFSPTIRTVLIIILAGNIIYGIYSLLKYLLVFRKVYGKYSKITNVYIGLAKLKIGDIIFSKYVNQSVLNIFILLILASISIYTIFMHLDYGNIMIAIGNIFLFLCQIILSYSVLKKLINLEMDYFILTTDNISLNQQEGIFATGAKSIGKPKIRTIDYSSKGFLPSYFDYGDLIIHTIGGTGTSDVPSKLTFISSPKKTVEECNRLLENKVQHISEKDNVYFSKILYEGGFLTKNLILTGIFDFEHSLLRYVGTHLPDLKKKLRVYIQKNEVTLKKDFENGDAETKKEIQEIYQVLFS